MLGPLAAGPAVVFVVVAVVLGVVLASTAIRRGQLAPVVADARRHGLSSSAAALVLGSAAAVVVVLADAAGPLGSGVSLALAPLTFGLVHTAVLAVGEQLWPLPHGAVRTASLTPRPFPSTTRWLRTTYRVVAVLVAATCALGWVTAGSDGRSITTSPASPPGLDGLVGPSTSGPYPGAVFALPALVGTSLLVLLTWLTVRAAMTRSAVPGDPRSETVLRAASVHRVLRGSTSALLLLLGGLWFFAGTALHVAGQDTVVGVDEETYLVAGPPGLQVLGSTAAVAGVVTALTALVLLLLPAARLQPAPPAAPTAAPVRA